MRSQQHQRRVQSPLNPPRAEDTTQEKDYQQHGRHIDSYQNNNNNYHKHRGNKRDFNNRNYHRKNTRNSYDVKKSNSDSQFLSLPKDDNGHHNRKNVPHEGSSKKNENQRREKNDSGGSGDSPRMDYSSVSSYSSGRSFDSVSSNPRESTQQRVYNKPPPAVVFNGFNSADFSQSSQQHYVQSYQIDYFKRPSMTLHNDYYLKFLYNYNTRIENPPNLRCQSQWDGVSEQIWDKYIMFRQSNATYCQKINVWFELHELLQRFPLFYHRAYSNWSLHLVGSTISGFGLDSSDVDICLALKSAPHLDPRAEALATLNEIKKFLLEIGNSFQDFYLINAKVPILRFHDATNTIEVDLNYNNCIGVRNTHLLNCYAQLDWRLRPLVIVVKLWAQHHNLNDARNGTISSYSLVLMVIHFLQYAVKPRVLPCLHVLRPDKFSVLHDISTIDVLEHLNLEWKSDSNRPIGELFLRFLDYYSNFDYVHNAISVRTGGTLPIEQCKNVRTPKNDPSHWQTLCIEEPFDLTNTARSTYDSEVFARIKNAFFQSFRRLNESKDLNVLFQDPLFVKQIQIHHQLYVYQPQVIQQKKNPFSDPSNSQISNR